MWQTISTANPETSRFRIQRLLPRHVLEVAEIAKNSFAKVWNPDEFAYFLEHESRVCFGAFGIGGSADLHGYAISLLIQGDLDIISIAVKSEARRLGLGERLLRRIMEEPRVERTFLEVDVENVPAIRLYEKLGFETASTRKAYYEQTRDALLMRHSRDGKGF